MENMLLLEQHLENVDPQQLYQTLLNETADGIYLVDRQRCILFWNLSAEKLTGYRAEEILGSRCADNILVHVDHQGQCLCQGTCPLEATMLDGEKRDAHVFLHHKAGHRVPVHVRTSPMRDRFNRILGGLEIFNDETSNMEYLTRLKELEKLAFIDELTGLANRRYLSQSLDAQFAEKIRLDKHFGVISIDIDHFNRFNNHYGHEVGDRVLQMVSNTLAHSARPYDTVARWGGEEFLILVGYAEFEELRQVAERFRLLVEQSNLFLNGEVLSVTISAGATLVRPEDNRETLLKRADDLLYISKESGRNRVTCRR